MAANDIITYNEASAYLTNPGSAEQLAGWISAVSVRLDTLCGPVVIRTITGELCDGGEKYVALKYRPVATVTSVVEYLGTAATTLAAETNSAKTASNYYLDTARGYLWRRSGGYDYSFPNGRGNIVVTYTAGRFASTAAVSDQFKQAALITLAHLWRSENGTANPVFATDTSPFGPSFAVPLRALEVLGTEVRPQVAVA